MSQNILHIANYILTLQPKLTKYNYIMKKSRLKKQSKEVSKYLIYSFRLLLRKNEKWDIFSKTEISILENWIRQINEQYDNLKSTL